jgi:hypothetical protein
MGFEFKSDQPEQKLVDNKTTLSVNGELAKGHTIPVDAKSGMYEEFGNAENDLTQDIFAEGEEEQLAIEFLEENGLYAKFLLWCGIKEQLKNLKLSLETPTE